MSTNQRTIKSLYPLALAEGEGVGTAYEYYAKRLVLLPWLAQIAAPKHLLVAGLPQVYGSSLDFLLLAHERGLRVTAIDDRPEAIDKLYRSLEAAQAIGELIGIEVDAYHVEDMSTFELEQSADIAVCSELFQRLSGDRQLMFVQQLSRNTRNFAIFTPNLANSGHTDHSGLAGVHLEGLQEVLLHVQQDAHFDVARSGYIDMPPFPPGISRSDDQREAATSGRGEAIAMWGLNYYARAEHWLPTAIRRSQSHIVYALVTG